MLLLLPFCLEMEKGESVDFNLKRTHYYFEGTEGIFLFLFGFLEAHKKVQKMQTKEEEEVCL